MIMNLQQAAKKVGKSKDTLRIAILEKKLQAIKVKDKRNKAWEISEDALQAYIDNLAINHITENFVDMSNYTEGEKKEVKNILYSLYKDLL